MLCLDLWFLENAPSVNKIKLRDKLVHWCDAKVKTYKDYHAALRKWVLKEHDENVKRGWKQIKSKDHRIDPFTEYQGDIS